VRKRVCFVRKTNITGKLIFHIIVKKGICESVQLKLKLKHCRNVQLARSRFRRF